MDYFCIAPILHVKDFTKFPNHLVEAPILQANPDLIPLYRRIRYVILDNGVGAGLPEVPWDDFLDLAKEIKAKEIVMPDKWKDAQGTIQAVTEAYYTVEGSKYKLMVVPHGRTLREWTQCYEAIRDLCDIVGLAYREWQDRSGLFRAMMTWILEEPDNVFPIHLLGLWNMKELKYCHPNTRGIDTSLPFRLAEKGLWVDHNITDTDRMDWNMRLDMTPNIHTDERFNSQRMSTSQYNVSMLQWICEQQKFNPFESEYHY